MHSLTAVIPALVTLASLLAAPQVASAQAPRGQHILAGRVIDTAGAPLADARVTLPVLGRAIVTRADGRFSFASLAPGTYTISVVRVGMAPHVERVSVGDAPHALEIRMRPVRVQLAAVQVTATPGATAARESPQPTAVLEGPELRIAQGAALGETLEQVPGIRSLSMTTGIGKPVIRGMTHYRVVTLDDGQRTETQAWGHDHSPNVETATAERVEVIKGPASVLYGSDALGGVINVVAPEVPEAIDVPAFVRGRVTSAYSHNVRGADATLLVEGARGGSGARAAVTMRGSGDMRTPAGTLHNTTNGATALEAAIAHRGSWGSLEARATGRDERIEIFDDPRANPGYTGFQRIATHRASLTMTMPLAAGRLHATGGHERNFRREFADAAASQADLGLFVSNWTATAQLHHAPLGALTGTIGTSAMTSDFENRGTETLIPSSGTRNVAVYVFEQLDHGRVRTTAGIRYDYRTLATEGHAGIGVPAQRRHFSAVTGSVGTLIRLSGPVALVANVARGFRAPAAPDLFANGFHEGTRAFERGNPSLGVETSINTELGLRVTRSDLTAELTGFVNHVSDYIYLRPFGTGARAFDSLQVVQGNARLTGVEGAVQYHPHDLVTLHMAGDYVRGDNTTSGVPLTFIPPLRVMYGGRVQSRRTSGLVRQPYLSLGGETNARQRRLDPSDVGTAGYTILNAGAGFARVVPRGLFTIDLSIRNLLDTRYRSFMSRYKEFALGPGRSVVLKASTTL
ncbi:MAG: TonB-dependent receptor [Gemmatimonadaceae bacterium]|nr:TonB-dependent receptor [Gemmatimonadaceae bacterium]